ncbi:MAG: hypothetical protein ACRDOU_07825 [Streptosporangiaceae bacterium]
MTVLITAADRASFRRCRRQWDFGGRAWGVGRGAAPPKFRRGRDG